MIESLQMVLSVLTVASSAPGARSVTPEPTPEVGSPAETARGYDALPIRRELRGARGWVLEDLRRDSPMVLESAGPCVVSLQVVPHRTATDLAPVVLELTRDGSVTRELEIECRPTADTFVGVDVPLPCAPVVSRIDVQEGVHRYGVRLLSGPGASAAWRIEDEVGAGGLDLEPLATPPAMAAVSRREERPGVPPSLPPSFWHAPPRRVWVTGGVGLVALGVAAYVGWLSQATFDEAAGDVTQLRREELNDRGATQARAANVLLGVGSASLGAALVMAVVDLLQEPELGGEADGQ